MANVAERELGHTLNLCIHSLNSVKAGIIIPPTRVCKALSNSEVFIFCRGSVCVRLYHAVFQAASSSGTIRIPVSGSNAGFARAHCCSANYVVELRMRHIDLLNLQKVSLKEIRKPCRMPQDRLKGK